MVHQALLPKDLFPVLFLPWRKGWGVRSGLLLVCFIRLWIFNLPAWADTTTGFGEVIPAGPGEVVAAGPGRTVPAGPGKVEAAGPEKGHWRTFRKEHGLVTNEVTRIFQDREGCLWFGTVHGVSRYDGQSFVNFTTQEGLANNVVVAICQDREGILWFGTYGGASRYDPSASDSGEVWTTFTMKDGLVGNNVQAIIEDLSGNLWFGARDGGVSRYNGKTFTNFTTKEGLAFDQIWSVLQDPEGNLWFGTDGGGVSQYDGKAFKTFTTKHGLASDIVYSIFQDREGDLWFSTINGGVSRYNGKTFKTFTTQEGLADNLLSTVCQDREGVFWFGTKFKGANRYDPSAVIREGESLFTHITTKDGLVDNSLEKIFQDRDGYLWFGTAGGASQYDPRTFITHTREDGLAHHDVLVILQGREGDLWLGTTEGVIQYDGKTFTTFTTQDGLADNTVSTIIQDQEGNLWFGSGLGGVGSGVSRYDGKTFTTFTTQDGLGNNQVESILQDREGNFWFGIFGGGVSRYDGETFTTFTTQDGLASNWVGAVLQDREGNFWFGSGGMGSGGSGVSRYDGKTFTTYNEKNGLAGNTVSVIFQDREGNLWFGGPDGVSCYDGKSFSKIAALSTHAILQDREGTLWFGTDDGLSRYDGLVFQTITDQDGLAGNRVWSILQDREGNLWFGTNKGITRFRQQAPSPPLVFIDAVVADRRYEKVSDLAIPSTVNITAFEFRGGMNFKTRPEAMVYRYRLKGYDQDWKNTHTRRVEYQDLPRGAYTFEVQAVDRDLVYSEQPATVKLNVFYQPISATVRISDVRVQDVFASFYKTYAEHSIGSVVVTNDAPDPVDARVSFHIPGLMPRPTGKKLTLEGQSEQRVDLNAILDEAILKLEGTQSVQAEVSLSSEVGDQRISVTEPTDIKVYGRGALTWEPLGRAAAFVTPEDRRVAGFARGLYDAYRQQMKGRRVDGNIPAAMLMFEALNGHGIRYAQDPSTPYSKVRSDRSAIDYIQYPSELLKSRRGDCDDCTVLYCSLLENLNIETAFVDAPDHILMMFDSGVTFRMELGFSLDPSLYVDRNGRYWIPVEVTKLGEGSFLEAWELGAKTCAVLAAEGSLEITDVREVWSDYPYATPTTEGELTYPDAEQFDQNFQASFRGLQAMRERYVEKEYIEPLMMDPGDHLRQMNFAKTRIEAEAYNDAIGLLMPLLSTDFGAEAYYMIGYANAAKKNYEAAIRYMEKALELEPENEGYSKSLQFLKTVTERPKAK